jgi:cell division protein ZapA
MKHSVEVTIAGQRYVLKSEGDDDHLRTLASYVSAKLEELRGVARALPPERLAILAALNLADELLRERAASRRLRAEVRKRTEALLGFVRALGQSEMWSPAAESGAPEERFEKFTDPAAGSGNGSELSTAPRSSSGSDGEAPARGSA